MKSTLVFLLVSASLAFAGDALTPPTKPVPDGTSWKLVALFQKALIAKTPLEAKQQELCRKDTECVKLAETFDKSVGELQTAFAQAKKDLGLSESEDLSIDTKAPEGKQVTIIAVKK